MSLASASRPSAPARSDDGSRRDEPHLDATDRSGARAERIGLALGASIVVVHAALTIDRSLWLDEAYTVGAIDDLALSLTRTHGTMGLYYGLIWTWGQVSLAASWLRLPSVLCALATLFVVRAIARRIGGRWLAAVSLPLLALIPMFEWKATEARSYSLETLLVALAWLLALDADEDGRRAPALLGLIGIAGALTHGLFVVLVVPLAIVAALGPRPARAVGRVAPVVVTSGAAALVLRSRGASNVGSTMVGGPSEWLRGTLQEYLPGPTPTQLVTFLALATGLGLGVRRVLRTRDPARRALDAVPVAWTLVPCVALMGVELVAPTYNPRYLAPIAPGIALVLAGAALSVGRAAARAGSATPAAERGGRVALAGAAVLGLCLAVALVTTPPRFAQDWRSAATLVSTDARPGDGIVFANLAEGEPVQHRPPFEAAWSESDHAVTPVVVTSTRPLGEVLRVETDLRSPAEVAAAAEGLDRLWVVDADMQGSAGTDAVMDDPRLAGFRPVGTWAFDGDVVVHLYARAV